MNERPWPNMTQITPVNVGAKTDTELQRVYATLNNLIAQFNDVIQQGGSLQSQITAIISRLANLLPFDGIDNSKFITNATLLEWPIDEFVIGKTVASVYEKLFEVNTFNTETRFYPAAGPVYAEAGAVYLDGFGDSGMLIDSEDLVLKRNGDAMLHFVSGSPNKVAFQSLAGVVIVGGAGVYLDTSENAGIYKSGNNLVLKATSGIITTASSVNTDGDLYADGYIRAGTNYYSADNTVGASATTGGATFKNGLYTGGTITGSGDPGTVEDVTVADPIDYWVRFNDTGPDNENGAWQNLATFFPGLPSPADTWTGNEYLDTLGTITTGEWTATPIASAYIADDAIVTAKILNANVTAAKLATDAVETAKIKDLNVTTGKLADGAVTAVKMADMDAYTILGNDTASPDSPYNLTVTEVLELLDLDLVENTALSTWAGTSNITNLGAVTTCPSLVSQGKIEGAYFVGNSIRAKTDSTSGILLTNAGYTQTVVWVDTVGFNITVQNAVNASYFVGGSLRAKTDGASGILLTNHDFTYSLLYATTSATPTAAANYITIPSLTVTGKLVIPVY